MASLFLKFTKLTLVAAAILLASQTFADAETKNDEPANNSYALDVEEADLEDDMQLGGSDDDFPIPNFDDEIEDGEFLDDNFNFEEDIKGTTPPPVKTEKAIKAPPPEPVADEAIPDDTTTFTIEDSTEPEEELSKKSADDEVTPNPDDATVPHSDETTVEAPPVDEEGSTAPTPIAVDNDADVVAPKIEPDGDITIRNEVDNITDDLINDDFLSDDMNDTPDLEAEMRPTDRIDQQKALAADAADKTIPQTAPLADDKDVIEKYKELNKHLLNFIKSFSKATPGQEADKKIKPVASLETSEDKTNKTGETPPTEEDKPQAEPNKTTAQEEDVNAFDEFMELDDDIGLEYNSEERQNTKPQKEEAPKQTNNDKVVEAVKQKASEIMDEQIKLLAGSCFDLPAKLESCENFTCSMPEKNTGGTTLNRSVSKTNDGSCMLTDKSDGKTELECKLSPESRKKMSEAISEYFQSGDSIAFSVPINIQPECPSIVTAQEPVKTETSIKLIEETPEKKANETQQVAAPTAKPTQKVLNLNAADKAYFELLDKKRKALPESQLLSESTLEIIKQTAPLLTPKKKSQEQAKTEYIGIEHGKKFVTGKTRGDVTKSQSGIDISIRNAGKDKDKVDIKTNIDMAYRALLAGQISAAISLYKSVLEIAHDNKDALFGLATAYHRNSQLNQAKAIYSEILILEPNNKEVLNNFLVLAAEEAPEGALLELQKLERINSDFSPIPAQIAMIYLKTGNPKKAERYLRRAVILSPGNITYKYNLAITSDRLGKYHQAVRLYKQLAESIRRGNIIPGSANDLLERLGFLEEKIRAK